MGEFNFFRGVDKKNDSVDNVGLKVENERLIEEKNKLESENDKLKQQILELQGLKEKENNIENKSYEENALFAPELKLFSEKVLGLMEMGFNLQKECNRFFSAEKGKATPEQIQLFYKAFAKFQLETCYIKIGEWREQLNNIVYNNGILIKPPVGKENNHSSVYATIRQAKKENRSEEQVIESFEKDISIALLGRYSGALLTLIEDMKIISYNGVSIPKEIEELRGKIRLQITKELGLKINNIDLLEKLNNNNNIEVIDEIKSPLTEEEERVVEVLSYGVGGYGGSRVDKTKVVISK